MSSAPGDLMRHGALQWALRRSRSQLGRQSPETESITHDAMPVIVTGMHRSGTSLLTRILESLGVFMGAQQGPETSEARYYAWQNEIFFRLASASWDAPEPLIETLTDERWRAEFANVAASWDKPPWRRMYWGRRSSSADRSDAEWGWKDPRNGLTLPVWSMLFPAARVVNIERDSTAVAKSLSVRSTKHLGSASGTSLRLIDVEHGTRLHESYITATRRNLRDVDQHRQHSLTYEELIAEPVPVVRRLAEFCALERSDSDIESAASLVSLGSA